MDYFFKAYGRSLFLEQEDIGWRSPVFRAFLQPLRYKNKLYLEGEFTLLGKDPNAVFLYIGPPDHDLQKVADSAVLTDADGQKYLIQHAETYYRGDKPHYCWAIVKKIIEVSLT